MYDEVHVFNVYETGPPGSGIAEGGTDGQALIKDGTTDFATHWTTLNANDITNTPSGSIAAEDVGAAITELDTDKAALAGATFTGPITIPAGISPWTAAVGGVLLGGFTPVPNGAGGGETTFMELEHPPGILHQDGAAMEVRAIVRTMTQGSNRRVRFYVNNFVVFDTGNFNAQANGALLLTILTYRTSATSGIVFCSCLGDSITDHRTTQFVPLLNVDHTVPVVAKMTGQAAQAGALQAVAGSTTFWPAPPLVGP